MKLKFGTERYLIMLTSIVVLKFESADKMNQT